MTKLVLWYINKNDNKIASTSNCYILITVKAFDFLTLDLTLHFSKTYFGVLHKYNAKVRYLMGFKTAISSGRKVQIASNSECM